MASPRHSVTQVAFSSRGPITGPALAIARFTSTAYLSATAMIAEGPLFLADYVLRLARVGVLVAIWQALLGGGGEMSGFTLASALAYTVIAEAFGEILAGETKLDIALWEGVIATRLLRPFTLVSQFAADASGRWAFGLATFSVPLLVLMTSMGIDLRPATVWSLVAFVPSLALAVGVGIALDFLFGALFIILDINVWVVSGLRRSLGTLLSGALLPLPLYPWGIGEVFGFLPFAAQASAPLRIYTGTGDILTLLATQAFWLVGLAFTALWLWNANRDRLVCYGG